MKLTIKQDRLLDYVIELGDYTNAARKAGYSEGSAKDAPNWFNPSKPQYKPYLQKALNERLAKLEDERIAKPKEVMKFLTASRKRSSWWKAWAMEYRDPAS